METASDFEDLLGLLEQHGVRYLIVGGLAFSFHATPRYTKDMDVWIDPADENVRRANHALAEFGSPLLLDSSKTSEITQLGVAPNRIGLLLDMECLPFSKAWPNRIQAAYGKVQACWIGIEELLRIKERINTPRHQEDARILKMVLKRRTIHQER